MKNAKKLASWILALTMATGTVPAMAADTAGEEVVSKKTCTLEFMEDGKLSSQVQHFLAKNSSGDK